jgi:hypothetical protein
MRIAAWLPSLKLTPRATPLPAAHFQLLPTSLHAPAIVASPQDACLPDPQQLLGGCIADGQTKVEALISIFNAR